MEMCSVSQECICNRRGMRDHARRRGELARQRLASGAGRLAGYGDFSMDRIQATVDSRIQQSLFNLGKGPRPVRNDLRGRLLY